VHLQLEVHDKKFINAGWDYSLAKSSPHLFIFDSMKRIIGHTCVASAKVVLQMQLM
jgi:hypothetical protein